MKNLLIPTILLLYYSGFKVPNYEKTDSSRSNDKLLVINCENILNNEKMVYLSQVASNVHYIRLETNPSCLLNNLRSIKLQSIPFWNVDPGLKKTVAEIIAKEAGKTFWSLKNSGCLQII